MPFLTPALLAACGAGAAAAVMYLTLLTGSASGMLFMYLSPLPLFLAGLAHGPGVAASAVVLAAFTILGVSGSVVLPGTFLLFSAVPVLAVVNRGLLSRAFPDGHREWYPPGRLLVTLTALGAGLIVLAVVAALAAGESEGLTGLIRTALAEPLLELFRAQGMADAGNPGSAIAEIVARVVPGVVVDSWLIMVIVNGLLAQAVLAHAEALPRPPLRMTDLAVPAGVPMALLAVLVGAVAVPGEAGTLLVNVAIVGMVPFFFAGLAVVHAYALRWPARGFLLLAFYVLLVLLAWPVLVMIGLGIIDQWAGLRRRFAAGSPDRGEV